MMRSTQTALLGLVLSAIPAHLLAQADPDSVKQRNDCRLAIQVVTLGQPANKAEWALRLVPACGSPGGAAIAALLQRQAQIGDPDVIERIMWAPTHIQDRAVYHAALSLAGDPAATTAARVQAIRVLAAQVHPVPGGTPLPYRSYANTYSRRSPVSLGGINAYSEEVAYSGEALPADAYDEVAAAMREIESGAGSSPEVKSAAQVLLSQIAVFRECIGLSRRDCARRLADPTGRTNNP